MRANLFLINTKAKLLLNENEAFPLMNSQTNPLISKDVIMVSPWWESDRRDFMVENVGIVVKKCPKFGEKVRIWGSKSGFWRKMLELW